jgi:hypothetical protein
MSAELLLPENMPREWQMYMPAYNPENNGSYTVATEALNHLLRCEIILDELMKSGIANWEEYEAAMESVLKRLKGGEE